ncbi:MAG: hypothetical protein IT308_03785 [Anaerolineaceae bacterium]|nr:hypothetical protein [Anaerolineaceae bacterium]
MTGLKGNLLKDKMKRGEKAIGAWITLTDPIVGRIFSQIGFDFVLIDLEHSAINQETLQAMLLMFEGTQSCPIVRVPAHDPVWAKWALDAGAEGILFPNVRAEEEARQVVQMAKYPPQGVRGFFPRVASNFTTDMGEYLDGINDRVNVWIQIEDIQAVNHLDAIFSVKGIDAVLVGPADLSLSMGMLFQWERPEFKDVLRKILEMGAEHGLPIGYPVDDTAEKALQYLQKGYQFVTTGMDSLLVQRAAKEILHEIRKG